MHFCLWKQLEIEHWLIYLTLLDIFSLDVIPRPIPDIFTVNSSDPSKPDLVDVAPSHGSHESDLGHMVFHVYL